MAAKLAPPALPVERLPRQELEERLDKGFERRLVAVVAGAGFGKSTLLASWARDRDAVWYTVDRTDRVLDRFVAGLVDAIRVRLPSFASEPGSSWLLPSGRDERTMAEAVAAELCEELSLHTDEVIVIVDDVHELGRRGASVRFLEALCRNMPPNVLLALC